jgi:hypothetical protein
MRIAAFVLMLCALTAAPAVAAPMAPAAGSGDLKMVVFLLLLFALIALLPDFEQKPWDGDAAKRTAHPEDPTDDRRI